jgi:DNA-binding transcriptional LysR family regulator
MTDLMQFSFKSLQIFVSLAETGSFKKAADAVHRSPSAVSMQIKLLEDQLGVALFHRTTRRVRLTQEGELLLGSAQRAMAELSGGLLRIREAVDMQTGHLSLGCVPSVAASVLPSVLSAYQRSYPAIRITLRELASEDLLRAISRQEVEFGIGPGVPRATEFLFQPLATDPIYALVPTHYEISSDDEIKVEELAALPVLMYSRSAALRGNLERELAARGLEFDIRYEILHAQTLVAFARAGLGVAILPKVTIPDRLGKNLRALRIVEPALERSLDLIKLRGHMLSPPAQELAALIERRFARMPKA